MQAVLFDASTMMYFERHLFGHVKRIAFNPLYAVNFVHLFVNNFELIIRHCLKDFSATYIAEHVNTMVQIF